MPLLNPRSCATKPPGSNPCWWKPGGHVTGVTNAKRLKRTYASEEDAQAAASLSASLAWGNPLLSPGVRITATGFKSEIDTTRWLISSAEHSMDASGLKTRIEMEVAA